jgi:hypothetical protein
MQCVHSALMLFLLLSLLIVVEHVRQWHKRPELHISHFSLHQISDLSTDHKFMTGSLVLKSERIGL